MAVVGAGDHLGCQGALQGGALPCQLFELAVQVVQALLAGGHGLRLLLLLLLQLLQLLGQLLAGVALVVEARQHELVGVAPCCSSCVGRGRLKLLHRHQRDGFLRVCRGEGQAVADLLVVVGALIQQVLQPGVAGIQPRLALARLLGEGVRLQEGLLVQLPELDEVQLAGHAGVCQLLLGGCHLLGVGGLVQPGPQDSHLVGYSLQVIERGLHGGRPQLCRLVYKRAC
jgi:hypothetical protein